MADFGTAAIYGTYGKRKKASPAWAPRYDCGKGRLLTVREICARTGLTGQGVRQRIRLGVTGEALLAKKVTPGSTATPRASLRTAVRLARAFPARVPTVAEIRRVVPLSASQASRYRAALRETLEAA